MLACSICPTPLVPSGSFAHSSDQTLFVSVSVSGLSMLAVINHVLDLGCMTGLNRTFVNSNRKYYRIYKCVICVTPKVANFLEVWVIIICGLVNIFLDINLTLNIIIQMPVKRGRSKSRSSKKPTKKAKSQGRVSSSYKATKKVKTVRSRSTGKLYKSENKSAYYAGASSAMEKKTGRSVTPKRTPKVSKKFVERVKKAVVTSTEPKYQRHVDKTNWAAGIVVVNFGSPIADNPTAQTVYTCTGTNTATDVGDYQFNNAVYQGGPTATSNHYGRYYPARFILQVGSEQNNLGNSTDFTVPDGPTRRNGREIADFSVRMNNYYRFRWARPIDAENGTDGRRKPAIEHHRVYLQHKAHWNNYNNDLIRDSMFRQYLIDPDNTLGGYQDPQLSIPLFKSERNPNVELQLQDIRNDFVVVKHDVEIVTPRRNYGQVQKVEAHTVTNLAIPNANTVSEHQDFQEYADAFIRWNNTVKFPKKLVYPDTWRPVDTDGDAEDFDGVNVRMVAGEPLIMEYFRVPVNCRGPQSVAVMYAESMVRFTDV